jgi:hypothetical protein
MASAGSDCRTPARRLDLVIHNAGVYEVERTVAEDGHETHSYR